MNWIKSNITDVYGSGLITCNLPLSYNEKHCISMVSSTQRNTTWYTWYETESLTQVTCGYLADSTLPRPFKPVVFSIGY